MGATKISDIEGRAALSDLAQSPAPSRAVTGIAVRWLLQKLATVAPGTSVEVRIPPFGVIQCVDGPTHRRGTPPNLVEMDAHTFVRLATGSLGWADGVSTGAIRASGIRSNLAGLFPLPDVMRE